MRYLYLTLYGLVKYLPTPIGDVLRYLLLKPFMKGLQTCWIHEGVTIHHPQNVRIGRKTTLNEDIFINGYGGVEIGRDVAIGQGTAFFSAEHGIEGTQIPPLHQPIQAKPIVVKDGAYFGFRVIVLGNVVIGRGAVIGAGSVVTRDIPDYAIAAGSPAKVIRMRSPS